MARNIGSRGWLGVIVTVVVLGGIAAIAIWMSLSRSTNPDYQVQAQGPGIDEYYVNLWLDPHPPTTGDVEISTQLSTTIGSPVELDRLDIAVQPPDEDSPVELDTGQTPDGPNGGELYVANTTFDQPGVWLVVVDYSFGGPAINNEFEIEVDG